MSDAVAHFEEPLEAPKMNFALPQVEFERAWALTKWLDAAPCEEFGDRFWENAQDVKQDIFDEHNELPKTWYFADFFIDGDKLMAIVSDGDALKEFNFEVSKIG